MGVRGVWVSQAAERGGCRVSFVSVETPSFSGGWLGPQCRVQPTEGYGAPGEGAGGLLCSPGAQSYLCAGSQGAVSASPQQSEDPQTSAQMPELSPLGPLLLPPLVTVLWISLWQ